MCLHMFPEFFPTNLSTFIVNTTMIFLNSMIFLSHSHIFPFKHPFGFLFGRAAISVRSVLLLLVSLSVETLPWLSLSLLGSWEKWELCLEKMNICWGDANDNIMAIIMNCLDFEWICLWFLSGKGCAFCLGNTTWESVDFAWKDKGGNRIARFTRQKQHHLPWFCNIQRVFSNIFDTFFGNLRFRKAPSKAKLEQPPAPARNLLALAGHFFHLFIKGAG